MSRLEHERVIPEEGMSQRLLELSKLYSGSALNSGAFNKSGTVVSRDSDDRLKNRHLKQAGSPAEEARQSVLDVALRIEIPSFDPIRPEETNQNGHEKWPGEEAIEAGGRPAFEPEKVESRAVEFGRLALFALTKRVSELKSSVNIPEIDTSRYTQIASKVFKSSNNGAKKGYKKGQEWAGSLYSEHKKDIKRGALALGGLALAGAAVYLGQKGYSELHHSHTAHGAAHNSAPQQATVPHEFKIPLHAVAVGVQAAHHAHRVTSAAKHAGYRVEHLKYYGDTIWFHAQSRMQAALGHKPSLTQLNEYVNRTLKLNHLNWDSAREMVKGQAIKLPIIHR